MQVYGTSKIYLIMATKALNEKLKGTGVEVFAAHPGRRPHFAQPPAAHHMRETCTLLFTPDKDPVRRLGWARSLHICTMMPAELSLTMSD